MYGRVGLSRWGDATLIKCLEEGKMKSIRDVAGLERWEVIYTWSGPFIQS